MLATLSTTELVASIRGSVGIKTASFGVPEGEGRGERLAGLGGSSIADWFVIPFHTVVARRDVKEVVNELRLGLGSAIWASGAGLSSSLESVSVSESLAGTGVGLGGTGGATAAGPGVDLQTVFRKRAPRPEEAVDDAITVGLWLSRCF